MRSIVLSGVAVIALHMSPAVAWDEAKTDIKVFERGGECVGQDIKACREKLLRQMTGDAEISDDPGARFLKAGHYGLAADYYLKRYQKDRLDTKAINGLAISYDKIGRFDLSKRFYKEALKANPQDRVALNNFGYSMLLQNKPHEAQALLSQANMMEQNLEMAERATKALDARVVEKPKPLIFRVNRGVQKLVLKPDAHFIRAAVKADVDPALAAPISSYRRPAVVRIITKKVQPVMMATVKQRPAAVQLTSATLEVSNGAGVRGMAARMRGYLKTAELPVKHLTNARHFRFQETVIFYAPNHRGEAEALAKHLPFDVKFEENSGLRTDLRLRLGGNAQQFDTQLEKSVML